MYEGVTEYFANLFHQSGLITEDFITAFQTKWSAQVQ
jgi:hypothetical protein